MKVCSKLFVPIDQWGQTVQLIIYKEKNGNLECVSDLVKGKQGGVPEVYLSHRAEDVTFSKATAMLYINCFP